MAYNRLRVLLHNTAPTVAKHRVRHYATCLATRAKAHYAHVLARKWWAWRHEYGQVWRIRLNREDPGWVGWASSTAWCESRMNSQAVGAGGLYYSYFQWAIGIGDSPNTWGAAGGYGDPRDASYSHQAVLAIRFAQANGRQHWPICGQ